VSTGKKATGIVNTRIKSFKFITGMITFLTGGVKKEMGIVKEVFDAVTF
jgi:hypothetical protein